MLAALCDFKSANTLLNSRPNCCWLRLLPQDYMIASTLWLPTSEGLTHVLEGMMQGSVALHMSCSAVLLQ